MSSTCRQTQPGDSRRLGAAPGLWRRPEGAWLVWASPVASPGKGWDELSFVSRWVWARQIAGSGLLFFFFFFSLLTPSLFPSLPPFCFPGGHFHVEPGQLGEPRGATFLWVPSGSRPEPQGLTHTQPHRHTGAHTEQPAAPAAPDPKLPTVPAPLGLSHPQQIQHPLRSPTDGAHTHSTHTRTHAPTPGEHLLSFPKELLLLPPGNLPPPSGGAPLPPRQATRVPSHFTPGKSTNPPFQPVAASRQPSPLARRFCRPRLPTVSLINSVPLGAARSAAGSALSRTCIAHVASITDFYHAILRLTDFRWFGCGLRKGDLLLQENRGGGAVEGDKHLFFLSVI